MINNIDRPELPTLENSSKLATGPVLVFLQNKVQQPTYSIINAWNQTIDPQQKYNNNMIYNECYFMDTMKMTFLVWCDLWVHEYNLPNI